eukprot:13513205-Heterocapsa_arctica.AAC.1
MNSATSNEMSLREARNWAVADEAQGGIDDVERNLVEADRNAMNLQDMVTECSTTPHPRSPCRFH